MHNTINATKTLANRLDDRAEAIDSLLCVGLDPILDRLPGSVPKTPDGVFGFCRDIIRSTSDHALAYKPNLAFFLALGRSGLDVLYRVCAEVPSGVPILLDCKTNDMGATAEHYARAWFDELDVDAITIAPYMGEDAIAPYLTNSAKGAFILTKTSNPGSGQIQDQVLGNGEPLYLQVAGLANEWNDTHASSVGLVVGATWPATMSEIRTKAPHLWILVPGIGEQGGSLEESLAAGLTSSGSGILASASRSILYASSGPDFADASGAAAADMVSQIRACRKMPVA